MLKEEDFDRGSEDDQVPLSGGGRGLPPQSTIEAMNRQSPSGVENLSRQMQAECGARYKEAKAVAEGHHRHLFREQGQHILQGEFGARYHAPEAATEVDHRHQQGRAGPSSTSPLSFC